MDEPQELKEDTEVPREAAIQGDRIKIASLPVFHKASC